MDKKTYTGITRSDVNDIRSGLGKFGIAIPEGDDVEVTGPLGVRMKVVYDEPTQMLELTILEKPGYVTENQIWKVIESGAARLSRST